jgi:WD40 repeat protein
MPPALKYTCCYLIMCAASVLESGCDVGEHAAPLGNVLAIGIPDDERTVVIVDHRGAISRCSTSTALCETITSIGPLFPHLSSLTANGRYLVYRSAEGAIRFTDLNTLHSTELPTNDESSQCIAISNDGGRVAVLTDRSLLLFLRIGEWQRVATFDAGVDMEGYKIGANQVRDLSEGRLTAFSRSGSILLARQRADSMVVVDLGTDSSRSVELPGLVTCVAEGLADGQLIVAGVDTSGASSDQGHRCCIWILDLKSIDQIKTININNKMPSVLYAIPDRDMLIVGSLNGEITAFSVSKGIRLWTQGGFGAIRSVRSTANGTNLIVGDTRRITHLDISGGQPKRVARW